MTIAITLLAIALIAAVAALAIAARNNASASARHAAIEAENRNIKDKCSKLEEGTASYESRIEILRAENTRLQNTNAAIGADNTSLARRCDELVRENSMLKDSCATLSAENARVNERLNFLDNADEQRRADEANRFKALATDILNANSRQIKERHDEHLNAILTPLRENIAKFEKSVNEHYGKEAIERASLSRQIEELVKANANIGNEARELSRALKGSSKVQGDWGEMVLDRILENSGLRKGEEYFVQVTKDAEGNALRNDDGKLLRPDVVVKYPGGRSLVIDSKVSFTAFHDAVKAAEELDHDKETEALQRHVASVRSHVKELSEKNYQDYLGDRDTAAEFVMMFIHHESAYIAAMKEDPALWEDAYKKRVLIVSPTHLVSALKLIAQLWLHDRQTKNAIEIASEAGKLYDKFVGFVDDMEAIDKSINNTRKNYDAAMNKLKTGKGNLITRVEGLRTLGAKATKSLPADDKPI